MVSKDVTCPLHDNLLFSVSKLQKKNLGKDTSCQMGHSVINADNQAKRIVNYSKRFGFVQSRECFRPAKAMPLSRHETKHNER